MDAALAALVSLDDYNERRIGENRETIDFGIGINFGAVTYGNIGGPDRLDFTVLGKAVNVASRVQGLCKSLDANALITAEVARHVPGGILSVGVQEIKGLTRKVELYRIER